MTTWNYPSLGTLTFSHGWSTLLKIPAFNAFSYDSGHKRPTPKGTYKISLEADTDTDLPSRKMLKVVDQLLAKSEKLATAITNALWDDFNGDGPDSGMWWHGDLDAVNETLKESPTGIILKKPGDIQKIIYLQSISFLKEQKAEKGRAIINPVTGKVIERVDIPHRPPLAHMHFYPAFEREHHLDILTDGLTVLGLGYAGEAEPFETQPR